MIGEHEVPVRIDVAARLEHPADLAGREKWIPQVLEDCATEDEVDRGVEHREGVHVGHRIDKGVQQHVGADDVRVVEFLVAAAQFECDVLVQQ